MTPTLDIEAIRARIVMDDLARMRVPNMPMRAADINRLATEVDHLTAANDALAGALEAAHDTLDAICMAGHVHLVSAGLPEGYGMDTFRTALKLYQEEKAG